MLKITNAILEIIDSNDFLSFGFSENLLNLTQVAKHIKPFIESRIKKEISLQSIIMNLSRISRRKLVISKKSIKFKIDKLTICSWLSCITYQNIIKVEEKIHEIYYLIKKINWYITIAQWANEVTIIFETKFLGDIKEIIKSKEKNLVGNISAIWISFNKIYANIPWLLKNLIQAVSMQWINITEMSSTYTEFTFYIDSKDTSLCFDTLQNKFL